MDSSSKSKSVISQTTPRPHPRGPGLGPSLAPGSTDIDDILKKIQELERVQKYIDRISEETEDDDEVEDEQDQISAASMDTDHDPTNSKPFSIIEELQDLDVDLDDDDFVGPLSSDLESLRAIISHGQGHDHEKTGDRTSFLDIQTADERSVDELLKEYEEFERHISLQAENHNQSTNRSTGSVNTRSETKLVPALSKPKPNNTATSNNESGLLDFSTGQFSSRTEMSFENSPSSFAPPPSKSVIERLNDQFSGRNKSQSKPEELFIEELKNLEEILDNEATRTEPETSGIEFGEEDKIFKPQLQEPPKVINVDSEKSFDEIAIKSHYMDHNPKRAKNLLGQLNETEELKKLRSEYANQEAILKAYQEENEKLFLELKETKDHLLRKEEDFAEENSKLKTEIATLKITHRLLPGGITPRTSNVEIDRLNAQLQEKTQQIFELHREIASLKSYSIGQGSGFNSRAINLAKNSPKTTKSLLMSQDKEAEYQKTIKNLEKQNRTLQKLIYHKDPNIKLGEMVVIGSKDGMEVNGNKVNITKSKSSENQQVEVLDTRISELESQLARADYDAKNKIKEFTQQLNNLKNKYEANIKDLEEKIMELEGKGKPPAQSIIEEMSNKLTKANNEISNLKAEISLYKRELEIASKSSNQHSSSRQDAATLSLAIKSFKSELAEKDKELIKLKKEIGELKKTNLGLKREREKYLSQAQFRSNVTKFNSKNVNKDFTEDRPMTGPGQAAYQLLQQTLEAERSEFEEVLMEKNRIIEGKDQSIRELRAKVDNFATTDKNDNSKNPMIQELRERVISQIKVITALKTHLTTCAAELNKLRKDKATQEYRIQELSQELELSKQLIKPESEILGELSRKVANLSSQYNYRERQIDSLLQRLSLKSSLPTCSNGLGSLDFSGPIGSGLSSPSHHSHANKADHLLTEISPLSPTSALRLLGSDAETYLNLVD